MRLALFLLAAACGATAHPQATEMAFDGERVLSAIHTPADVEAACATTARELTRLGSSKDLAGVQAFDRLITIAMLAAINRSDELKGHIRGALNNGATPDEIAEVFLHSAVYLGWPAAGTSLRIAVEVFRECGLC